MEVKNLNNKIKKIISLFVACLIWMFALPCAKTNASVLRAIKNTVTSLTGSNSQGENSFNFIKANESSTDFLYDGSLFLYGGITFIAISILGIIITLKPKKKKKKKIKNTVSRKTKR